MNDESGGMSKESIMTCFHCLKFRYELNVRTALVIKSFTFCPHSASEFRKILRVIPNVYPNINNVWMFVIEVRCIFCDVWTEFLSIIYMKFILWSVRSCISVFFLSNWGKLKNPNQDNLCLGTNYCNGAQFFIFCSHNNDEGQLFPCLDQYFNSLRTDQTLYNKIYEFSTCIPEHISLPSSSNIHLLLH